MPLVGLWAFLFTVGNGVDQSGNGNSALFRNGAAQETSGNVVFDGVDDYVEIPSIAPYESSEGTIRVTFTAASGSMDGTRSSDVNDESLQGLVSRDSSGFDGGGHVTILLDGDGSLFIRHQSDTTDYIIQTAPGTITEAQEFDLVYSFSDTGGMTAYVNGVVVGSNDAMVAAGDSIAPSGNSEPWVLGAAQMASGDGVADNLAQHFTGQIGHFEIYDQALPPTELTTLHDLSDGSDDGIITGTEGADSIYGGNRVDAPDGGAVIDDTISAGGGADFIRSGDGDDLIYGGEGGDNIASGSGDDTIFGEAGNDSVQGGAGNDSLYGGSGNDTLLGEGGNDLIEGGSGDDNVQGGDGDNLLYGGAGEDIVYGGTGTDTIFGGDGADILYGAEGTNTLHGDAGGDTFYLFVGDDTAYGGDDADIFYVFGETGSDEIFGGEGGFDQDIVDLQYLNTGVSAVFTGDEAGTFQYGLNSVDFAEIEGFLGSDFADIIDASSTTGGVAIGSGGGDDQVTTGSGDDTIAAGEGDDRIEAGAGDDTIGTGAGQDVVVLTDGGGNDLITDFDLGDPDGVGRSTDQLDVSDLRDLDGNPVNVWDTVVSENAFGDAVLSFPRGETVTLQGVSASQMSNQQMRSSGVPCFASGTLIATASGEVPVEDLRVGDQVLTHEYGLQPVYWIGRRSLSSRALRETPALRPIRLAPAWTGTERALLVSAQHGIAVETKKHGPCLVRAAQLARLPGGSVRVAQGKRGITYHHLLLARHATLWANGVLAESFFPGPRSVATLSTTDRRALRRALHTLGCNDAQKGYGPLLFPTPSLVASARTFPTCTPCAPAGRLRF